MLQPGCFDLTLEMFDLGLQFLYNRLCAITRTLHCIGCLLVLSGVSWQKLKSLVRPALVFRLEAATVRGLPLVIKEDGYE